VRRPSLNFIVDALGFAGFAFMTTTGVLMRYVLPPGSGHYTTVWGLDRHEWGSIHFWVAVVFFAVLALHVWLHWRWIVAVVRGRPREGSGTRVALGVVGLVALLALALAPFVSPVERDGAALHAPGRHARTGESDEAIRGYMTLGEIEEATGVPRAWILRDLGIPPDVPPDQHTGQLVRRYGLTMQDVRRIVEEYQGEN
jgi:hypothetical protein